METNLRLFLLAATLLMGACATEEPGITPDKNAFYFPTGLALDPDRRVSDKSGGFSRYILYVTNSNADLNYNSSTLNVLDLKKIPANLDKIKERVTSTDSKLKLDCQPDRVASTRWECDEKQFIISGATLQMGDYPAGVQVSSLINRPDPTRLPQNQRVFVPVRGQNYLLWADALDLDNGSLDLRCNALCQNTTDADCATWSCDAAHQVSLSDDTAIRLPSEPYGIYLHELKAVHVNDKGKRRTCSDGVSSVSCGCPKDSNGDYADPCDTSGDDPRPYPPKKTCCIPAPAEDHLYLLHLAGGEVSYFTVGASGVHLRDARGGFFSISGSIRGGYDIAPQRPGDASSPIYISSRVNSIMASFIIDDSHRILDHGRTSVAIISPGNDVRGIVFGPAGETLYAVDRLPPTLVALDMSDKGGTPRKDPLWAVEVCAEPSVLRLVQNPTRPNDPQALLAYVVCFAAAQIYVVDTQLRRVVDKILVGSGPHGLAVDSTNKRAFVANFLDNTVGLIDLDPSHASFHQMVLRIGMITNMVRQ